MKERDPSYVTPRIKLLLRKRSLGRAGKIEHADCIAVKINRLLANNRSTVLAGADNADTKQLWTLLKKTGNWGAQKQNVTNLDPDHINDYFASIATDQNYNRDRVIQAARQAPNCPASHVTYSKYSIEHILARTSKTSPGNDKVPYWLFRDCSSELAGVVANIVNLFVGEGVAPAAWRTAVITPVPKCTPVNSVTDL